MLLLVVVLVAVAIARYAPLRHVPISPGLSVTSRNNISGVYCRALQYAASHRNYVGVHMIRNADRRTPRKSFKVRSPLLEVAKHIQSSGMCLVWETKEL